MRHLIGAHAPVAGGLAKATLPYLEATGSGVVQVFVSNPRGWALSPGDPAQDEAFVAGLDQRSVPAFVHASLLHIGMNLLGIVNLGRALEPHFRTARFLLLYLMSGLLGYVATLYWRGDRAFSVGASGALFGLLGAYIGTASPGEGHSLSLDETMAFYKLAAETLKGKVPARDAMAILGHSRIAMTLEIYTASGEPAHRTALDRVSEALKSRANRLPPNAGIGR